MPWGQRQQFILNVINYFDQNLGLPEVSVEMTPQSQPIQIPASGGSFNFLISLANNGGAVQSFDAWIKALLPNGSYYGPVLGPVALTLPSGGSLERNRTQTVPGSAPPGNYSYIAYAGDYPNTVWDTDAFPFTKLTTGADNPFVSDWSSTGGPLGLATPIIPTEFALRNAYPNPFNASTRLTYDLPVAAKVSLKIFNIQGRLVATLINGSRPAGSHQVTFDASHLASGIYLYKLNAGDFEASGKMVLLK